MGFLALFLFPLAALATNAVENPSNISSVYSVECEATFVEGEGVSIGQMSCPANQRLGLLQATYTHYLFSSFTDNNFHEHERTRMYPLLCNREVPRVTCHKNPKLQFGLSRHAEGIFQRPIILAANSRQITRTYGYAAQPDFSGKCPNGLLELQGFDAIPPSIQYPLPSNFQNISGGLNDLALVVEGEERPDFIITRQANQEPCWINGDCSQAVFHSAQIVQRVPYYSRNTMVCVIPKEEIPLIAAP